MQSLKNDLGNIVLQKDGNMISTTDVKKAQGLVGEGYSVFINKSGTKLTKQAKKTTKK